MKRWHPFAQLFLNRQREFYREPAVLFWVYGFPLFLAIGLGIAFSGRQQNAGAVAIQEAPGIDTQKGAGKVRDVPAPANA